MDAEGDWVIPTKTFMGTWSSLAVWKEKEVIKLEKDIMPIEYVAMIRELFLAFR